LAQLNDHLNNQTWLVGERITIADVFVATALGNMFTGLIDASMRAKIPNVVRYFET
jgi:elongation factor 1-gamma